MDRTIRRSAVMIVFMCAFSFLRWKHEVEYPEPPMYYTVVAPDVLRPNSDYDVAITMLGTNQPVTVTLDVGGNRDSGGFYSENTFVSVEPYITRIAKLKIRDIGPGSYNLTVRGDQAFSFINSTALKFMQKSRSVLIQSDKAIYKPGHKVHFRVLVLTSHLKPSDLSSIDVYIKDGGGNRVKEWNRVEPVRGVFSDELELSTQPVLGDWEIVVKASGQEFTKQFTVAEYVLPKFEVTLEVPPHVTFKDSKFPVTVRAKYTYGRPVKGEATISMYPRFVSDVLQPVYDPPAHKKIKIDGKGVTEFDAVADLSLNEDYERQILFEVVVKEDLTGREQNSTSSLWVHRHKYKLELDKTSEFFKPGLKYTAFLRLVHHDGVPVTDKTNKIKVRYGYSYDEAEYVEDQYPVSDNGIVELNFYPPVNATTLGIEGEYLDVKEWFSTVSPAVSPSNSFIQAILLTSNPTVNDDVEIEVNSTSELTHLTYQILGRGDVVLANSVQVPKGERTGRFRFLATSLMAPTAHLVVQYVTPEGEVVADGLDIELAGALQNYVKIDAYPNEVEPGASVGITVESKPNSYVGLMGIDQSVILLKKGNDITEENVLDELRTYDSTPGKLKIRGRGVDVERRRRRSLRRASHALRRSRRSLFWWPGSFTAKETFNKAGAVILTNALVHEHTPWRSSKDEVPKVIKFQSHSRNRGSDRTRGGSRMMIPTKADTYQVGRPIPKPGTPGYKPDIGPRVPYNRGGRPGLAGPFAFSRLPSQVIHRPRVHFSDSNIPTNTWLFSNFTIGYQGKHTVSKVVPDTITSWVITGFSLDSVYGLGLSESPTKVKVFRPFFVSLDLPYSVMRGESLSIPVVVFNYMNKPVQAEVTLENSGQFEFADFSNDVNHQPKLELFRKKTITVPSNSGATTSFMITPKELGYIDIKVQAKSPLAGDAVVKKLLVKPEGETQYRNKAIFVDLRSNNSHTTNITLDIPVNFVSGSEYIEVSAVGNLLGASLQNLDKLIQMPFGCGEQNMLNFVPNIVILDYLTNSNQLSKAIETKTKRYLNLGFQQELTYKHKNNSYSAFGTADPSGSTWLTAFVAKSFKQARHYIDIDDSAIIGPLEWLADNQAPNGSFPEVGAVSHKEMQGGSSQGLALTAYVITAFIDTQTVTNRFRNTINKGMDYIHRQIKSGEVDTYSIAVASYALHSTNHPSKDAAFELLESRAKTKDDMKWWAREQGSEDSKNPNAQLPNSIDVEMTAYAMLTYLEKGLIGDAIPVMKWLISQQNEQGGFASTQDTVVALGALARLAEAIIYSDVDISAKFEYHPGVSADIRVNPANAMILQKTELPKKVRQLNITATGRGFAILQVSYRYNVNVTGAWPMFNLDPQVDKNSNKNHLQLSICSSYIGGNQSNMAVMEVTLPSGYTVDSDKLPSLEFSQSVKRVETKEGDTVVVLYFDQMTAKELCPTVSAFRTHKVAKQRPVPVTLYDYYDQSRKARVFYEPLVANLCDICENEDCKICNGGAPGSDSQTGDGSATAYGPSLFLVLVTLILSRNIH